MYKIDFLNELNEKINDKSETELKDIIIKFAKQLPSSLYPEFLALFSTDEILIEDIEIEDVSGKVQSLFARIDELNAEIEGGQYEFRWSYSDSYDYEYHYDDYDIEDDYNELIDENGLGKKLDALFAGVMDLVHLGEYEAANQLFNRLFALEVNDEYETISVENLFDHGVLLTPQNKARYTHAYSVLMAQQGNSRVSRFFEIINTGEHNIKHFKLEDVLQVGRKELPNVATFYQEWIQYLTGLTEDNVVRERDVFLLDALTHSGGIGALVKFVDDNGMNIPAMCFKLIDLHIEGERYDDAHTLIYNGFESLKGVDSNKKILADYLIRIARLIDNQEYFRMGYVEAFQASLEFSYFVEILRIGDSGLIEEAVDYLRLNKDKAHEIAYYLIEFLMGEYQLVWERCARDNKALGWSSYGVYWGSSSILKGSLFPLFLALLSEGKVGEVTSRLVEGQFDYEGFDELLAQSFRELDMEEYQQYFKWCKDEIEKRVIAIVGNQHRKSYHKASALIVAMAEVMMIDVNEIAAMSYVRNFKEMFPRHNAFTKCLRADLALIGYTL